MSAPFDRFRVKTGWCCTNFKVELEFCCSLSEAEDKWMHREIRERQRRFIEDAIREKLEREKPAPAQREKK